MKQTLLTILACASFSTGYTQQVPQAIVVEHFTNSHCGVCAGRNPGMFNTLATLPDVIHVAYYPSAPYSGCQINQMAKSENDARTNFYGIYGSTPRIVVQGSPVNPSTNYADANLYTQHQGKFTSFAMNMSAWQSSATTASISLTIKKVDTSSLTDVKLYGVLVQDTLYFTALNGENYHYNLLRTPIWDASARSITLPTNVGDSIVMTQTVNINSSWGDASRLYSVAILQQDNKQLIQATRSNKLQHPTGTNNITGVNNIDIYPNPANDQLTINGLNNTPTTITIMNVNGSVINQISSNTATQQIDVSALSKGLYIIKISSKEQTITERFIKQ